MKSGCRAEEARLETAERLAKFLALIPVVSWRMFFLSGRVPSQTVHNALVGDVRGANMVRSGRSQAASHGAEGHASLIMRKLLSRA
ncbi:hypothetical protein NMG46_24680 [Mesorhizobium sp. LMG 17147]|uniref:hypothetical protein n=1 Tax=Mesorhizobium sp. LMG 17147 TaxID=2963091 RepID=UPI0020C97163|nr:hypothetical protein [Mesorhizobium sp. LMG 17147]MCP9233391.1 hypothetical protein [Mesorhizobium sp. LMG 17147]